MGCDVRAHSIPSYFQLDSWYVRFLLGLDVAFIPLFVGWISIFARLAVFGSSAFVTAQLIQGTIRLSLETYEPLRWHGTMLYWMTLLLTALINVLGTRVFPHIETFAFILHISFFFVLLVPLIYLSPRSTAQFVFADFENSGGWDDDGISWCIGLVAVAFSFVSECIL